MDPRLAEWTLPLLLLALGFGCGRWIERKHLRSLALREHAMRRIPALNVRRPPPHWKIVGSSLVTGSVVISVDHWKRFAALWWSLVGGRIRSYESLLERARREAVLRVQEGARRGGYDAVLNLRFESTRIAGPRSDGQGTAGVEVLAWGTAVKLDKAAARAA